ncbi:cation efflux system protein [Legionella quinlivanii]|uniref:Cation efflux system protein n=1 Tax=Legionella quinlivanii TaxID=45073 RepID=A0A0W0XU39_9GAMM|nr:cation diffusion facilitator family transporter [Legionella quinlivanii]KTD48101.1 cation efflux system protein [Legionella quinlivanii]SEG39756.1 cobalt-zinc-cadmium efflux system protein [Legionella quinlivanii DSM 21216]STY09940.1 cation efflux system protein, CDF family [Legionella quinlivanii]
MTTQDKHSHHDHDHSSHGHSHPAPAYSRAFLIAIVANGIFVICQIVFAIIANSSSLLADAIHNLGDVLGLILSWIANSLLTRSPTDKTTYGLKKTSIIAALTNGILLVFTCGIIATDAVYKLFSETEVQAVSVMIVAAIGILVNGATAALFMKGTDDLNIKSAFLHLLYDAFISVGVVISAAILYWTGWQWIDPVVGILIAVIIIKGTWGLFKDSFRLLIDGVPTGISLIAVRDQLEAIPGVKQVHDLHIWALSTRENALSVHLWMPEQVLSDERRREVVSMLEKSHNITHVTIQVESSLEYCEDACSPNER